MAEAKQAKFAGKVLVVGPTGKVGAPAVKALVAQNVRVRVLVRDEAKAKAILGESPLIDYAKGDLDQLKTVSAALKGVERLFLITNGLPALELEVAKAAKDAGVKLLVKLSVYGASHDEPHGTPLRNHAISEDNIEALGIPFVFLRPSFFFQNYFAEAQGVKNQAAIYRPKGSFSIVHVDTRDIAEVAATVLSAADVSRHVGKTYYITANEDSSLSGPRVAALLSQVVGKQVNCVPVEDAAFYQTLQGFGMPERLAFAVLKLYQAWRRGTMSTAQGDLKLVTGQEPRSLLSFFTENKAAFV